MNSEYLRFKAKPSPNGSSNESIVIVASAVRNEDGTVKVSIFSDAKGIVPEFLIQPINSRELIPSDNKNRLAGKANKVVFRNSQAS